MPPARRARPRWGPNLAARCLEQDSRRGPSPWLPTHPGQRQSPGAESRETWPHPAPPFDSAVVQSRLLARHPSARHVTQRSHLHRVATRLGLLRPLQERGGANATGGDVLRRHAPLLGTTSEPVLVPGPLGNQPARSAAVKRGHGSSTKPANKGARQCYNLQLLKPEFALPGPLIFGRNHSGCAIYI